LKSSECRAAEQLLLCTHSWLCDKKLKIYLDENSADRYMLYRSLVATVYDIMMFILPNDFLRAVKHGLNIWKGTAIAAMSWKKMLYDWNIWEGNYENITTVCRIVDATGKEVKYSC
jgi:hypothetical protein